MIAAFFMPHAAIAVATPDKKACVAPQMYIDEEGLTQFGSYEVFVEGKDGKWAPAGKITDGKNYVSKQLDLSAFLKPGEAAKIRIVNTDGGMAHIDYVALGGLAPTKVMVNGIIDEKAVHKLVKADMDVMPAHAKVIDLTFPANRKDATLTLSARIEALNISPYDFKFPVENIYTDIGAKSKFFTYELGANLGKLSLKGKSGEIGEMVPFFKEFSVTGSGHPSAFTYGWVMNDDKYLYVAIDFTADNTEDGNKDYTKVFVKINGKVKEFKLSEDQGKWGKPSFTYTDKVAYEHKYYEYKIPLEEVGGKESKNLELAFSAYGTACAAVPTFTGANPYSFGNVNVGSSSAPVSVTLGASAAGGASLNSITITTHTNFSLNAGTCVAAAPLNPATCVFSMTFSPIAAGLQNDSITATISNGCLPSPSLTLNISGTGVEARHSHITGGGGLNLGGGSFNTGEPYTGDLTFTNDGNASMYIYGVDRTLAKAGANALTQSGGLIPPLYIATDNCSGKVLYPRDYCTMKIVFFPIEDGTYTQSFTLTTNEQQQITSNVTGTSISVTGNKKPTAFKLNDAVVSGTGVMLTWNAATDPDNDTVSYNVQYCDKASFQNCAPQSSGGATLVASSKGSQYGLSMAGAILAFGFMAFGGIRSRKMKLLLVAFALSYGAMGQSCGGGSSSTPEPAVKQAVMKQSFTGLKADTTYYWKVVATDKRGGAVESDTRTFVTGH